MYIRADGCIIAPASRFRAVAAITGLGHAVIHAKIVLSLSIHLDLMWVQSQDEHVLRCGSGCVLEAGPHAFGASELLGVQDHVDVAADAHLRGGTRAA